METCFVTKAFNLVPRRSFSHHFIYTSGRIYHQEILLLYSDLEIGEDLQSSEMFS